MKALKRNVIHIEYMDLLDIIVFWKMLMEIYWVIFAIV